MAQVTQVLPVKVKKKLSYISKRYHKKYDINRISKHHYSDDRLTKYLTDRLEKLGFKYLSSGSYRHVYVSYDGKYVLKIDRSSIYGENRDEVEAFKRLPKKFRHVVVAPIAYARNYRWILMPKVETENELSVERIDEIESEIYRLLNKYNLYHSDMHSGNVGLQNGKPVIIDYADLNIRSID